MKLEIPTQ